MSEHELEQLLQSARRGLSPSDADAQRVLSRVQVATAGIGAGAADPAGSDVTGSVSGGGGVSGAVGGAWSATLPTVIAIAALSAAVGYYVGHERASARVQTERALALAQPVVPLARTAPSAEPEPRVPNPDPDPRIPSPDPDPDPDPDLDPDPESRVPNPDPESRSAKKRVPGDPNAAPELRAKPITDTPEPAPALRVPSPSLQAEIEGLRGVERALREQAYPLALARLAALDRAVPDGQLGEERLAAFVIARCGLGLSDPTALQIEFSQRHPGSVYFARVKQACARGRSAP